MNPCFRLWKAGHQMGNKGGQALETGSRWVVGRRPGGPTAGGDQTRFWGWAQWEAWGRGQRRQEHSWAAGHGGVRVVHWSVHRSPAISHLPACKKPVGALGGLWGGEALGPGWLAWSCVCSEF